jgi:hypothetical protein
MGHPELQVLQVLVENPVLLGLLDLVVPPVVRVVAEHQVQVELVVLPVQVVLQEHRVVRVVAEHQVQVELVVPQEHRVLVVRAVLMVFQVVLFITLTNQ